MKRLAALLAMFALLAACAPQPSTSTIFAMDTVMELQIYGDEELLRGAEQLIYSLERKLSVTDERSEIFQINAGRGGEVSANTAELLEFALDVCADTGGAVDISVYPVTKAWGFTTGDYRVPSDDELDELLKSVGHEKVSVSGCAVVMEDGMEIDLGAVAKGYAGAKVADFLRKNGVESALINLGGNVQTVGAKPDGSPWKVAIADPEGSGYLGTVEVIDCAVVTSGGYQRYFEEDGETYWHIIDPSTGRPARSGLKSVTVVGSDGALCDALSTALFVMGADRAAEYLRTNPDVEAVLATDDGRILITGGLEQSFAADRSYAGVRPEVIARGE